jgi:hypothetical protein
MFVMAVTKRSKECAIGSHPGSSQGCGVVLYPEIRPNSMEQVS